VKGDFFASLHPGMLIVSSLDDGDGSECENVYMQWLRRLLVNNINTDYS